MARNISSACLEPLELRRLLSTAILNVVPDAGFGSDGNVQTNGDALIQTLSDGAVIAVGGTSATRLGKDGAVDSDFVDHGATVQPLQDELAVLHDKIVTIAGKLPGTQTYLVRAISAESGAVIASFGSGGSLTFTPPAFSKHTTIADSDLTSMIVTDNGEVILSITQTLTPASGSSAAAPTGADAFYKFTGAGNLDPTFGNGGIDIFNAGNYQARADMVSLSDGKFLDLALTATSAVIERRLPGGSLDPAFGSGGQVSANLLGYESPAFTNPVLQSNGQIVFGINVDVDANQLAYIARLNANGSTDKSFGADGLVDLGVGRVGPIAVDASNRIVGVFDSDLFRLNNDGTLDTTFDDDGFAAMLNTSPAAITTDAADRILIADNATSAITRYTAIQSVFLQPNRILEIAGSDSADNIIGTISKGVVTINFDGRGYNFSANKIAGIAAYLGDGDDSIDLSALNIPSTIHGGDGNDHIVTGDNAQSLYGDAGSDRIFGGSDSDLLSGGGGNDFLYGEMGKDRLYGGEGRDHIYGGGGDDRLFGGGGGDWLYSQNGSDQLNGQGGLDRLYASNSIGNSTLQGGAGNDLFITRNNLVDDLFGNGGVNSALVDQSDLLTSIQTIL